MTKFADIILALVAKVGEVVQDENAIIVTARRELPVLVGDFDVLLRIRSMRDTEGTTNAAGRSAMWIRRFIDIIIRARQFADVSKQDLQWLTDETNGILEIEYKLLDALQLWFPVTGQTPQENSSTPIAGNTPTALLIEPARIISGEDAIRDVMTSGRGSTAADPGWGMLAMRLDIYYEQTLTISKDRL